MSIRPCQAGDAEALTDLHLDVWEDAYAGLVSAEFFEGRRRERATRIEGWRQVIATDTSRVLVAEDEDHRRLLGFSCTATRRDYPDASLPRVELMALYVRAGVYGHGIGYRLLRASIGDASAYLWVVESNTRAIHFYERQGFRFDGNARTEDIGLERRMVRQPG